MVHPQKNSFFKFDAGVGCFRPRGIHMQIQEDVCLIILKNLASNGENGEVLPLEKI